MTKREDCAVNFTWFQRHSNTYEFYFIRRRRIANLKKTTTKTISMGILNRRDNDSSCDLTNQLLLMTNLYEWRIRFSSKVQFVAQATRKGYLC